MCMVIRVAILLGLEIFLNSIPSLSAAPSFVLATSSRCTRGTITTRHHLHQSNILGPLNPLGWITRKKTLVLNLLMVICMVMTCTRITAAAGSFLSFPPPRFLFAVVRGKSFTNQIYNIPRYQFASSVSRRVTATRNISMMMSRQLPSVSSGLIPHPQNQNEQLYRVYLAVGSNLGERFQNIIKALDLLCTSTLITTSTSAGDDDKDYNVLLRRRRNSFCQLVKTSFLYETAPMYVLDQPPFINGAVVLETNYSPVDLLKRLKEIEADLGRDLVGGVRNGPRPVDLDILFYEKIYESDDKEMEDKTVEKITGTNDTMMVINDRPFLVIPHPRMQEREFVLLPLMDVAPPNLSHPVLNCTLNEIMQQYRVSQDARIQESHIDTVGSSSRTAFRVLPLPRGRVIPFNKTLIMGILNVTPDSFSDGGNWTGSIDLAVRRGLEMVQQGADIIDIGGESTRPGAQEVALDEELERTIPVIERLRQKSNTVISIDTRRSKVARAAVLAGADIVNDVSGGTYDVDMMSTVQEFQIPMVLMHMRGNPQTMLSLTKYDDVVEDVGHALRERSIIAEQSGVHRWLQIADPGIGFAKDLKGNLLLLRNLSRIRSLTDGLPLLLGTSRKGFIGKIAGEPSPEERDPGTIASCVTALCLETTSEPSERCNIVRVHNVAATRQAMLVMEAIVGVSNEV